MANNYNPIAFTKRAVFGMDTDTGLSTSNDYNDHIRPEGSNPPGFEFDMLDYLTNGAGRYAVPAIFPIIDNFFQSSSIEPGTYFEDSPNGGAILSIYDALEIFDDPSTDDTNELEATKEASIWQYGTDVTSDDFAERAYLFGTTDFKLDLTNAEFVVNSNGRRSVSGMRVIAEDDNFDFKSDSPLNEIANFFLLPAFDPYGLIRETVPIKYTTSTQGREYFYNDDFYINDNVKEDLFISVKNTSAGFAKLGIGLGILLEDIKRSATRSSEYLRNIDSNPFFKYERDNSKVIYGTPGSDDIGVFKDIDIEFYNDNPIRVASGFDVPSSPNLTNLLMVGGDGNDTITSYAVGDELLGGNGNDILNGGGGDDTLNGGSDNDSLNGGTGEDLAIFSGNFEDYDYDLSEDGETITFNHVRGTQTDGTDTLRNIEFAEFQGNQLEPLPRIAANTETGTTAGVAAATGSAPRIIPLPLEDGVEETVSQQVYVEPPTGFAPDPVTPPHLALTAPVSMLDGDIDYTVTVSPYQPDTEYNLAYIIDASPNSGDDLTTVTNAYIDLTNFFIDAGIADNIKFSIVPFSERAVLYPNYSAENAIVLLENLSTINDIRMVFNNGLQKGLDGFAESPADLLTTTNIAYFTTNDRNQWNPFDPSDPIYTQDAMDLRRFAHVQAFGYNLANQSQLNFVDSNDGVFVGDVSNLSTELLKSGLAGDVAEIKIRLDGQVVKTITPEQLTDTPLGLTYEGTIDNLDVSIDAENVVTAEVVFNNTLPTTTVEHTVTAGESETVDAEGNPIDQSDNDTGNDNPFERELNGSDGDDEITLSYTDLGANGGAGNDYILGNNRSNILNGGAGDDQILAYGGDDTITTGAGRDQVDGGAGIDTVVYGDVVYQGNSNLSLRRAGNSVSYNNTDTLTNVEFIQFSDVRISTETLEITPIVEIAEEVITITEGDSGNTNAQFTFNLTTAAPVDVTFNYSTADLDAVAGIDYVATTGQITISAGMTTASLNLEIIGDIEDEANESFAINLSGLTGATFEDNQIESSLVATIANDDAPPTTSDNTIGEYGTIDNLDHVTQTIDLVNTYTNPVVFVQPPSFNGDQPALVRLDNITTDSFEAMIQEPNHLDGGHARESVSYFVLEAGTWQLEDGTLLEVGTIDSSGLVIEGFDTVEFEQEFETAPVIMSQVQSNNGTDFVRTRQQNSTVNGFEVGMEEEEALRDSGHVEESLGWLAMEPGSGQWGNSTYYAGQTSDSINHEWSNLDFNSLFDSRPQIMAGISSYDGPDPAGLRYRNLNNNAVEIKLEEDTSYDSEVGHTTEVVDFLAVSGEGTLSAVATPQATVMGEVGTINNLNQFNQTITLNNTYTNPVVFALPLSYNGVDPAIARITDIQNNNFSLNLQEPEYRDGGHNLETVTYLVLEAGSWELADGTKLEVGQVDTDLVTTSGWSEIDFSSDFPSTPAVLSQVQTDNDPEFVRTRQRASSADGFLLTMEEEEALKASGHSTETVGWLAMETGSGTWSDFDYTVASTANEINESWETILFGQTFGQTPNILASLSSFAGGDPAGLRYQNLGVSEVDIKLEEDQSLDSEIAHVNESVDFLAIAGSGDLSAIAVDNSI